MSDDEIFYAALEQETKAAQRELVESLCANDLGQLERVWGLLETHCQLQDADEQKISILDRSDIVFQAFTGVDELKPGKQLGKYLLGNLIGQGATSLVFHAQQLMPVKRDVALKILKPGMDSQRILARFGLEHQVINRLEHPGITPVYDVGVQDNGRPFFAMELVPNPLTITQYVEHFRLELHSRVRLMVATCEIVQHAHQRGVIHRDLKPSNILVEGIAHPIPKPRIIDFGIAKVMQSSEDSRNFTTLGDRFGTPEYMSPEQALMPASSLDIRSDVYSLGVILYELITGVTPRKASISSAADIPWTSESYWEYEIQSPSRVQLRNKATCSSSKELDWIILKAIAKDRMDRYQTVADLQRDLQRFLVGEPVEAAGPGLVYRTKKLISRNRTISTAAIASLMTMIITSILTASYAYRARRAEQQMRFQLQETLKTQKQLLLSQDRAQKAVLNSQAILRLFQVQWVTEKAFNRYLAQTLQNAEPGTLMNSEHLPSINWQLDALGQPHNRLIVKGNWDWLFAAIDPEIIQSQIQFTSREAGQALASTQADSTDYPDGDADPLEQNTSHSPATEPPAQSPNLILGSQGTKDIGVAGNRESLQSMMLEELRNALPMNDPFIAEVLDNCGLQAIDRKCPKEAEQFLSEAVQIWKHCHKYEANLTQSQLFLAEALLMQGNLALAESLLRDACQTLREVPAENPDMGALRDFYSKLLTQSKNLMQPK